MAAPPLSVLSYCLLYHWVLCGHVSCRGWEPPLQPPVLLNLTFSFQLTETRWCNCLTNCDSQEPCISSETRMTSCGWNGIRFGVTTTPENIQHERCPPSAARQGLTVPFQSIQFPWSFPYFVTLQAQTSMCFSWTSQDGSAQRST